MKDKFLLLTVLAISLIARLIDLNYNSGHIDESLYSVAFHLEYVNTWLTGSKYLWPLIASIANTIGSIVWFDHLSGGMIFMRAVCTIFGVVSVFFVYKLTDNISKKFIKINNSINYTAVFSAFLFSITAQFIYIQTTALYDSMALMFFIASFYFLSKGMATERLEKSNISRFKHILNQWPLLLSAILLILSGATRYMYMGCSLIPILYACIESFNNEENKKPIHHILTSFPFIVIIIGMFTLGIFNKTIFIKILPFTFLPILIFYLILSLFLSKNFRNTALFFYVPFFVFLAVFLIITYPYFFEAIAHVEKISDDYGSSSTLIGILNSIIYQIRTILPLCIVSIIFLLIRVFFVKKVTSQQIFTILFILLAASFVPIYHFFWLGNDYQIHKNLIITIFLLSIISSFIFELLNHLEKKIENKAFKVKYIFRIVLSFLFIIISYLSYNFISKPSLFYLRHTYPDLRPVLYAIDSIGLSKIDKIGIITFNDFEYLRAFGEKNIEFYFYRKIQYTNLHPLEYAQDQKIKWVVLDSPGQPLKEGEQIYGFIVKKVILTPKAYPEAPHENQVYIFENLHSDIEKKEVTLTPIPRYTWQYPDPFVPGEGILLAMYSKTGKGFDLSRAKALIFTFDKSFKGYKFCPKLYPEGQNIDNKIGTVIPEYEIPTNNNSTYITVRIPIEDFLNIKNEYHSYFKDNKGNINLLKRKHLNNIKYIEIISDSWVNNYFIRNNFRKFAIFNEIYVELEDGKTVKAQELSRTF